MRPAQIAGERRIEAFFAKVLCERRGGREIPGVARTTKVVDLPEVAL